MSAKILHLPVFLFIYNIFIRLYYVVIRISSTWNPKARLWWKGRENIFNRIKSSLQPDGRPVIWMHCASLGEFEQGRFLLENIKIEYPLTRIVLTFFSPSGYEPMKNYKGADHIFYLPLATNAAAIKFLDLVNPILVLWIKYDYWYHYLHEIKKRKIPLLLISAIFQKHYAFFRWYGSLYREMLHCFTWLFVQTPESAARLNGIGFSGNISINGDTRFDRVIDIAENFREIPAINSFCGNLPVIVAGSTWPDDEQQLDHYANTHSDIRFIIAPHEIDEEHLRGIEKLFKNALRYSEWENKPGNEPCNTLIIDNIGMLSRLYYYATIAYVGGGFGDDGVHNVLEAAVYGKPVVFGPVFNKFREAIDLLEEGAASTTDNTLDLEKIFDELLQQEDNYRERAEAARNYVYSRRGATRNIMNYIQENRLLTN